MKVYFVRHGETTANQQQIHQDAQTELSERGIKQAQFLGLRLKEISFTNAYCSSMTRTQQTAAIIKPNILPQIHITNDLVEWKQPSEILGKSWHDEAVVKLKRAIDQERQQNESYQYQDEETFTAIKERCARVQTLLEAQPKDSNVLMISHAAFIKLFTGFLLYGSGMQMDQTFHIRHFLQLQNTGITILEFIKRDWYPWQLVMWNDHAHLG